MTYALADYPGSERIQISSIHPGLIETEMTTEDSPIIGTEAEGEFPETVELGETGTPEDVADTAVYPASNPSSYVSGESSVVDGGLTHTQQGIVLAFPNPCPCVILACTKYISSHVSIGHFVVAVESIGRISISG